MAKQAAAKKAREEDGEDSDPGPGGEGGAKAGVGPETALLSRVLGWFGLRRSHEGSLREAVEEALEEHGEYADAPVDPEEKNLIQNVLSFGEISVSDVMIPQSEMVTVEYGISREELVKAFVEQRHTRLPVYKGTIDGIAGFLHVKDMVQVLGGGAEFSMEALLREILFVPPSMRIADLLVQMRQSAVHMAIVVDEYGGTSGLVTLEDLFEEIVGEIHDEHDADEGEAPLAWNGGGSVVVDASERIDRLEEALHIALADGEEEDYDTLGGLILSVLGRMPRKGDTAVLKRAGIRFEVLDADERRIDKVRLVKLEPLENGA